MSVDASADHFALFGLKRSFSVDQAELKARYLELQQSLHPDRFVAAGESERRWSVQMAGRVNDAFTTLRSPLARAVYLLSLGGVNIDEETDTRMAPEFLMEQMELREAIEAAPMANDPHVALHELRGRLKKLDDASSVAFARAFESGDAAAARTEARQWQFVEKLRREVGRAEARLDDDG